MEIEECKQISILDVANRLGISLNKFRAVSMNILNTIHFGFFQLPILLNGFQEIFKVMSLILFDLFREFPLKKLYPFFLKNLFKKKLFKKKERDHFIIL